MAARFEGKTALVTGGSSGIGRATAIAFAREGATVVIGDVESKGSLETVHLIEESGGEAIYIDCDVSDHKSVENLVRQTVGKYGRLNCAFNNAGIGGEMATTAEYSVESWNKVIGVNLTGVWHCMKYELEQMVKQGSGAIVNNASILGVVGFANACAYTASKHGLLGLTKAAALEYAEKNIRVNAVCPGFIDTPMLQNAGITEGSDMRTMIESLHPINRLGTSEEVAEAVLFLCSDGASFITGHPLLVDGGYVVR